MKLGMFNPPDDLNIAIEHNFFLSEDMHYAVVWAANAQRKGRLPLLTIMPRQDVSHVFPMLSSMKPPFLVRYAHEFNGTWYPWSGDRHLKDDWKRIKESLPAGALHVWCPNIDYQGAYKLEDFWPGDDYVDIIGLDGYNKINGAPNLYPGNLFTPTMEVIRQNVSRTKPMMICETASPRDKGQALWALQLVGWANDANMKSVVWFNKDKSDGDWALGKHALARFLGD